MNISTPLILFIAGAGVLQAILLSALLYFHSKSDRSVTLFLSLHILNVGLLMLTSIASYLFSWQSIILFLPFHFLVGPFLYLYVRSFKEEITWRKAWPHLLLFFIVLLTAIQSYFAWTDQYSDSGTVPKEIILEPYTYIRAILRNVQMLVYFFLARRSLKKYQKSILHLYSETSRINLNWVKWLLNAYLIMIIAVILGVVVLLMYPGAFNLIILLIIGIVFTPYIYIVTLKGITQPSLWQLQPEKDKQEIEKEISDAEKIELTQKEKKEDHPSAKGLPENKVTEIIADVVSLMEKEKLYQEPELTLQALSEKLGIQSYQASQAINDGLKKNFYDLVNGYRVEEAKRLLLDPKNDHYTILSVGFEAGFNSKTTFHTVFKKFTRLTPTEYREKFKPVSQEA